MILCMLGIFFLGLYTSKAIPQVPGSIWQFPAFQSQPLVVPTASPTTGDILVDNFEYWDSPYNHGWTQSEPDYPVYGFGMGYATIFNTVLDLQEGSRVLDVYRPASIFLIGTPYAKHFISLFLPTTSADGGAGINLDPNSDDPINAVLSFKFRAPLGMEPWDIFEFLVNGTTLGEDGTAGTDDDRAFQIQIRPIQRPSGGLGGGSTTMNMGSYHASLLDAGSSNAPMLIQVNIGRNFLDGSWHTVWLDLNEVNQKAHGASLSKAWELATAIQIMVGGQMFRLDDITFRIQDYRIMQPPDLVEIGPRYAQIFEPYRYLFMAEYGTDGSVPPVNELLLDAGNFLVDPNDIMDAWLQDSNVGGVIQMDPNYLDPNHSSYGAPEPYYTDLLGRDFVIDINLPVFSNPAFRIGGTKAAAMRTQTLGWNATLNSYGANGIQTSGQFGATSIVAPLPINPYDGMPTYIMLYYYTGFKAVNSVNRFPSSSYNKAHYGPVECFILESALYSAGLVVWPHVAFMDYTPQYFEDLILTIEVTNGIMSDVETFPISVVNYPVENYPPVVQMRICPRIFYVGEEKECAIWFADPDSFFFSIAQFLGLTPATTHLPNLPGNQIRDDQDQLYYQISANGLASYQYGPWMDTLINPCNGLTKFTPQFEGVLRTVVTCRDNRGGLAVGERNIYMVNRGTWLNHPPLMERMPVRPIVVRAGEELVITHPQLMVTDPDGDEMYASCNIGSVGKTDSGKFIWIFQTNFPGFYNVEIIFYDIRGGYTIMRIKVDVKPWWSY
jgi:hypothetical protein